MNLVAKRNIQGAAVVATLLFAAANFAHASSRSDEQSLERGAVEDVTPQQEYRSAIREAGGAYKAALRECGPVAGDDRRACNRDAKAIYDRDMSDATLILRGRALRARVRG